MNVLYFFFFILLPMTCFAAAQYKTAETSEPGTPTTPGAVGDDEVHISMSSSGTLPSTTTSAGAAVAASGKGASASTEKTGMVVASTAATQEQDVKVAREILLSKLENLKKHCIAQAAEANKGESSKKEINIVAWGIKFAQLVDLLPIKALNPKRQTLIFGNQKAPQKAPEETSQDSTFDTVDKYCTDTFSALQLTISPLKDLAELQAALAVLEKFLADKHITLPEQVRVS